METAGFMAESVEKIFHLSEQVISSVLWCSGDIVKVGALGGGGGRCIHVQAYMAIG